MIGGSYRSVGSCEMNLIQNATKIANFQKRHISLCISRSCRKLMETCRNMSDAQPKAQIFGEICVSLILVDINLCFLHSYDRSHD